MQVFKNSDQFCDGVEIFKLVRYHHYVYLMAYEVLTRVSLYCFVIYMQLLTYLEQLARYLELKLALSTSLALRFDPLPVSMPVRLSLNF